MATLRWTGGAQDTYAIKTITIANTWATGDTITLTVNGKVLVLTIGAVVTTAGVAAALTAAFNATSATGDVIGTESRNVGGQEIPEFANLTATTVGSTTVLTGDVIGIDHTITAGETTAGTGTASLASTVTASGKNWWSNDANWSTGAKPIATNDVYVDNSDIAILYGIDQNAITLASLNIALNYIAALGLPLKNAGGFIDYREDYHKISATLVNIGQGDGQGSGRLKLNTGTVATTINVYNTGSPLESGLPALMLLGAHATNILEVLNGDVGVAVLGSETAQFATVRNSGGDLSLGTGCTLATVEHSDGNTNAASNITTLTVTGGEFTLNGAATVTGGTCSAGRIYWNASGTVTAFTVSGSGVLDLSRDITPITFTDLTVGEGGLVYDPHSRLTVTNNVTKGANVKQISAA
tara:strand:- start:17164 stop:18399 length:1236 start_codon:yes stop_codon:yes gene_type:complete